MGKKILFVISPGRQSTEALHWCLHKAKETNRGLKIIYVIDENITRNIERQLAETGFIGDKPGQELSQALNVEYVERGKKCLEEMEKQGHTFQLPVETEMKEGAYIDVCLTEANKEDVDLLVVTEKKDGFFKKLFEGNEMNRLEGKIGCGIKIYK